MGDISVVSTLAGRTYLEVVQRVMRGCGFPAPSTLVGANKSVVVAMSSVQQALDEVWAHTDWLWKRVWAPPVNLSFSLMWYELPVDFTTIKVPPTPKLGAEALIYQDYEDIMAAYPGLRNLPTEWMDVSLLTEAAALTEYQGDPKWYTLWNNFLGVFPWPDADYIADYPTLIYGYTKAAPILTYDNDSLEIPLSLFNALEFLARGYMKGVFEYPGATADEARGLTMLRRAGAENPKVTNQEYYHRANR